MKRWGIVACVVGLASCSNDVNFEPMNPFLGEWSCFENESQRFPDATVTGLPVKVRYLITSPEQGRLVVSREGDAGSCTLQFSAQSAAATLLPGQSCQGVDGMTHAYTNGTASVASDMLNMSFGYDISQGATAGSPARNGTGDVTDECTR